MSRQEHVSPEGLADATLPYVAYGSLRPGQPAFRRIERYVLSAQDVQLRGALIVRDGLPLLEPARNGGGDPILATLILFKQGKQQEAYEAVQAFEPGQHYRWLEVEIAGRLVNALVGHGITDGERLHCRFDEPVWSSWRDPVFTYGLSAVRQVVDADAGDEFTSAPSHAFDWRRFFSLQMAYLLLWSSVERYCALAFGPDVSPSDKLRRLAKDPFAKNRLRLVTRQDEVRDVRDPSNVYSLGANAYDSLHYYYQVRNNLSHRGKGAWYDAEKVRLSLVEMTSVMEDLIADGLNGEGSAIQSRDWLGATDALVPSD